MSQPAYPIFPDLRSLGWNVKMSISFDNEQVKATAGRMVRASMEAWPTYTFELTYEALHDEWFQNDLQQIMGLYLASRGSWGTILYRGRSQLDKPCTQQLLGTGNGSNNVFAFVRSIGNFSDPVGYVDATSVNVYLNGALQPPTSYSVDNSVFPNQLTFIGAVGQGVSVTADFVYWYLCMFADDNLDFEQFMAGLWQLQSCKLMTVKP